MPDTKTREELSQLAAKLRQTLEAGLSAQWKLLERSYPLALMLLADKKDPADLRSHEFESLVDAYYGLAAEPWVAAYLQLHADLVARGFDAQDRSYEFGTDAYVWAAADRTLPEKDLGLDYKALFGPDYEHEPGSRRARAIVLETQSRNFLVVLNENFGRWSLHLREFWADIRLEQAKGRYLGTLDAYKERKDLSLQDVIALSSMAESFGDHLPGVHYPRRPHLSTFLEGSLMAGEDEAGIGLRYGDSRDRGYILSLCVGSDDRPEVKHALQAVYGDIAYVAYNLASAIDCLGDEA